MIRESTEVQAAHAKLVKTSGFTVCAKKCDNCLFDKTRLVMGDDAARIIRNARQADSYFACHEFHDYADESDSETGPGSYTPTSVCCKAYYDAVGTDSQQIRMATALGIVKFVDRDGNQVPDPEDYPACPDK